MRNHTGTLCFVNSLIECMSRCDVLLHALSKDSFDKRADQAFTLLFHTRMNAPHVDRLRDELVKEIDSRYGTNSFQSQGDPQEFWIRWVEHILDPDTKGRSGNLRVHESTAKEYSKAHLAGMQTLPTLVSDTCTTVTCGSCGFSIKSHNPMSTIVLYPEDHMTTIEELWNSYSSPQYAEWTCDQCKVCSKSTIQHSISRYSDVLVLCVSRWTSTGTKHNVSVGANVELGPYRLKGILAHSGSGASYGHYVCCVPGNPNILLDDGIKHSFSGSNSNGLFYCPRGMDMYMAVYERA